jgi:hypothetical protein
VRAVHLGIIASLAAATLPGAEVYRQVDADGNVTYSDRPMGADAETIIIETPPPSTPPVIAAPPSPGPGAAGSEPDAAPQREPREPTPEERAAERAANCDVARERLDRYMMARRLYRSTPDGEREYLSDAEIDAARAEAAADVEEWCD